MAKGRQCIFCGASGSLSDEHVIPKWLILENKAAGYASPAERPCSRITSQTPEGASTLERPLSPHGILINKQVCRGCNNGWMGKGLETEFSQVFKRLVRMELTEITHPAVAELMVRWALKTCMVHDVTIGPGISYSQDDRTMLMQGKIPPNTDVQLGLLEGRGAHTGVDLSVMDLGDVDGVQILGTLEVLYAGPIAFLIRRSAQGNKYFELLARSQHFASEWIPLHSIMPQTTSSKQTISEEKISAFLDRPFHG